LMEQLPHAVEDDKALEWARKRIKRYQAGDLGQTRWFSGYSIHQIGDLLRGPEGAPDGD
jgi:hypothetical protein